MTRSILTPVILAAAALSMGTIGCKTRAFNSTASGTRGATGTPGVLPVPVGVDAKLITDLAAPEDDPPAEVTSDAIVKLPNGRVRLASGDEVGPCSAVDRVALGLRSL